MEEQIPPQEQSGAAIRSPFEGVRSSISNGPSKMQKAAVWVGCGAAALVLIAVLAVVLNNSLNNPLRTLKDFPVEEYYDNHSALEGGRYKGELRVISSLGWRENVGRLVNFEVGPNNKPIVILIPPSLNETRFEPGDKFTAELRIGEGGLVKAGFLKRN